MVVLSDDDHFGRVLDWGFFWGFRVFELHFCDYGVLGFLFLVGATVFFRVEHI